MIYRCVNKSGNTNPSAKLTKKIAEEIRAEYAKGYSTQESLAKKYKVSSSAIGKILRRESFVGLP